MNSARTEWEKEYSAAASGITTPDALDQKVFAQARRYKPVRTENRTLSKAASGLSAVAIAVVLLHPAQYLGALTPKHTGDNRELEDLSLQFQPIMAEIAAQPDEWQELRDEVDAGNYVALCSQWRSLQLDSNEDVLPTALEAEARQHCRMLPTRP